MKAVVVIGLLFAHAVCACDGERIESPPPASPAPPPVGAAAPRERSRDTASAPETSHAGEPCGELAMTRAGMTAAGLGENHPKVVGVDALLAQCADKTPSSESCRRVANELIESTARGLGENHPKIRALRAKKGLCPE